MNALRLTDYISIQHPDPRRRTDGANPDPSLYLFRDLEHGALERDNRSTTDPDEESARSFARHVFHVAQEYDRHLGRLYAPNGTYSLILRDATVASLYDGLADRIAIGSRRYERVRYVDPVNDGEPVPFGAFPRAREVARRMRVMRQHGIPRYCIVNPVRCAAPESRWTVDHSPMFDAFHGQGIRPDEQGVNHVEVAGVAGRLDEVFTIDAFSMTWVRCAGNAAIGAYSYFAHRAFVARESRYAVPSAIPKPIRQLIDLLSRHGNEPDAVYRLRYDGYAFDFARLSPEAALATGCVVRLPVGDADATPSSKG